MKHPMFNRSLLERLGVLCENQSGEWLFVAAVMAFTVDITHVETTRFE